MLGVLVTLPRGLYKLKRLHIRKPSFVPTRQVDGNMTGPILVIQVPNKVESNGSFFDSPLLFTRKRFGLLSKDRTGVTCLISAIFIALFKTLWRLLDNTVEAKVK